MKVGSHLPQFATAFVLALWLVPVSAFGQCDEDQYFWNADSGNWLEADNWIHSEWDAYEGGCVDLPGVPTSDDAALIWNGGTVTVTNAVICRWTDIGPGGVVMVEPGGRLTSTDEVAVRGVLRQTEGVVDTQGTVRVAGGLYALSGGTIFITHRLVVGDQGMGEFLQSGGLVCTERLIVGNQGSTGTFTQTGGVLNVSADVNIGEDGTGTFVVNGGIINGARGMYVYGGTGSLTGPGTFNIRVEYLSERIYGTNRNDQVAVAFAPNCLTEGGVFSVTQITPSDFAGGSVANLLPSSVFDINFAGSYCGEFLIGIPYDEDEVHALDQNEMNLVILHQTGPETYERLETLVIDTEDDRVCARANSFGKFAVQVKVPVILSFLDKADLSRQVIGAAADGASKVVIQITGLPEDITSDDIQISIPEGAIDGSLENDKKISNGVFTQTYVVPACFIRTGHPEDSNASTRSVEMTITVNDDPIDFEPLSLIRPPVVMVHGLWGYPGDFSDLGNTLAVNGWLYLYLASYDNKASFATNIPKVKADIINSLNGPRRAMYAATKVDVVAHSMGGCLSKLIDNAFLQKNVRKIITIGTPHQGSPVANRVFGLRETDPVEFNIIQGIFNILATGHRNSLSGGAVEDLRTKDANNPYMNIPAEVPGVDCKNIILGLRDGSPGQHLSLYLTLGRWVTGTNPLLPDQTVHDRIFGPGVPSDWVVSLDSQKGDSTTFRPIPVSWHSIEPRDPDFIQLVIEFLNQEAQPALLLGTLPTQETNRVAHQEQISLISTESTSHHITMSGASEPNGSVQIVSPTEGETCTAGQSITISIQGTGDTSQAALFALFGTSSWADIVAIPWVGDVNVPPDSVGSSAKIMVIGLTEDMNMTDEDEVNLILESDIVLQEIFLGFGDTWYFDFITDPLQSHQLQLYPMGRFSDGSEYPLSVLGNQTTYQSLNECVATVDSNGIITVHSKGQDSIVVTNSSITTTVLIEVDTYSGDLDIDGDVDFTDFALFADNWLETDCEESNDWCGSRDFDKSGSVDIFDLAELARNWLAGK